jgi:hypothetical protein
MPNLIRLLTVLVVLALAMPAAAADICVSCHTGKTPQIVEDWKLSKHAENDVGCVACHGDEHKSPKTVDKAKFASPDVCAECHSDQVEQYRRGKHSKAWMALTAMPTTHYQPMVILQGMEGCSGCHSIGIQDEETADSLREQGVRYGVAACDSCHTRHLFSKKEASQPQACQTCHMGMDHPQWEMYSSSKHGVRYLLKQAGELPQDAAAPTCQTCHMNEGNHANMTAWGFLAVRLPMPEDEEWAADRATVLKGLGVLSPDGEPTKRLDAVKAADVARLTEEAFQKERDKMIAICSDCHSENFAKRELEKGDMMIREADKLMAHSIETVAGLYEDGILEKPENYMFAYPDILTFHDAPTTIETDLFIMFLKHRMRTFQGSFHQNPDYSLWYGWSEMTRDVTAIDEKAARMRREAKEAGQIE